MFSSPLRTCGVLGGAFALLASAMPAQTWNTLTGDAPIVIGHRGASGYRPEHTLAAYTLAIEQGANFIEPDLVMTKDGVLVARHENALAVVNPNTNAITEATSNVHELAQYADRKTTKVIDGVNVTGWFTEDFTLAELKTLKARERIPQIRPGNTAYNDQFEIPTLTEVIALAQQKSAETGRTIGIYPELKHSTYFAGVSASLGLGTMEDKLVAALHGAYGNTATAPVFIQSFEVANLQYLATQTDIRLAQLINFGAGSRPYDFVVAGDARTYADLVGAAGLEFINDYADGVGVNKTYIIARDGSQHLLSPTDLVARAHAAGLAVHAWTFRAENNFLPADFVSGANPQLLGNGQGEILAFLATGLDGFFTDHPDVGVAAVAAAAAIPEPGTWAALAGAGALGVAALRRRRSQVE